MPHLVPKMLLAFLLVTITGSLNGQQQNTEQLKALWKNPVVIGASVSDGYDRNEPIGGVESEKLSLEHYLEELIAVPHGKIKNFGNKFFFMNPASVSVKQVENAMKLKPSFILAPDFLFWLVYGNKPSAEARILSLERGLSLLEGFDCPIVLGNIPDASKAVYKMLAPSQLPHLVTIQAANKRIQDWVSKRSNVVILDNASFMKNSHANQEIKLQHHTYTKGETKGLLQTDFLHPTAKGAVAVCCALLESLQHHTRFPESDVNWMLK